jgi:hypothetical protein
LQAVADPPSSWQAKVLFASVLSKVKLALVPLVRLAGCPVIEVAGGVVSYLAELSVNVDAALALLAAS